MLGIGTGRDRLGGGQWREIMREISPARGSTQDHGAHGAETRDRVINFNARAAGKVLALDVRHELAMTGGRGGGQSESASGRSLGEID